jgi:DNA-binding beta-propeller fold protein YncE
MPAEITCEHCGASVVTPEDASATGVTCPYCQQRIALRRAREIAPLDVVPPRSSLPVAPIVGVGVLLVAMLAGVFVALRRSPAPAPRNDTPTTAADSMAATAPDTVPGTASVPTKPSYFREIESFGGHGGLAGQFMSADHLAVDGAGDVWVADGESSRIQKLDAHGKHLLQLTRDENEVPNVAALAADAKGNVFYDSDEENGVVVVISAYDGHALARIKVPDAGDRFYDLVVDQTGALFASVEDAASQYFVVKIDAKGKILARYEKTKKNDLAEGRMAIDDEGALYVPHPFERKIYVFDTKGSLASRWGSAGQGPGDFDLGFKGVTWDFHGHVLAANDGVQVFDREGRFVARMAGWSQPVNDLAMAPDGTLYVLAGDDTVHHYALEPSALGK